MRVLVWVAHLAVPVLGLWLLIAKPSFDLRWEHHGAHFWLVLALGAIASALGAVVSHQARARGDARLVLVGLGFMVSAAFIGLHGLATPGVILHHPNTGFMVASPVGLLITSLFAAASSLQMDDTEAARIVRWQRPLALLIVAVVVAWAAWSVIGLPPLDGPLGATEAHGPFVGVATAGCLFYGIAAWNYWKVYRRRPAVMLLSVLTAFVLLAEAMIAVAWARNWQASWWEWHILAITAFAFVAYSAHVQYTREGRAGGIFDSVGLEHTVQSVRDDYAKALESLVGAIEARRGGDDRPLGPVVEGRFDLTERQVQVLEESAQAVARERDQIRRLGALVSVGEQSSVIQDEAELVGAVTTLVRDAFGGDQVDIELDPDAVVPDTTDQQVTVSLLVKGNRAGVLLATRPPAAGPFAEHDVAILRSLGAEVSTLVENARLYRQLDGLFRSYLSPEVATALIADPSQAELGGQVREVTVLMADLRGYTPFSERSTPEEVMATLNTYYSAVVPVVLAEGGTVVQFVGDAIMAIFNAPTAQPDHALRAARAGLALQRTVAAVAEGNPDWPRFRVGINSGPAVVGNVGGNEIRNFTAIGDTTNLAARLEAAAEVGSVVIGPLTRTLLGDAAVVRPMGPLVIKGKTEPVEAFVLEGV